jgi:arginine-tRNA-protein transferase
VLEVQINEPTIDSERIRLFNTHRQLRGLSNGDDPIDEGGYAAFLTHTCCETMELTCWYGGKLVACAIADLGRQSLSAVYAFYDPTFKLLSLGTYCVLREVQFCQSTNRRYTYLGYYVADSEHMSYKSRFHPHQRRISGQWLDFP